jgi:hypothetical protein
MIVLSAAGSVRSMLSVAPDSGFTSIVNLSFSSGIVVALVRPTSTADLDPVVVRGVRDCVVTVKQPYRYLGLFAGIEDVVAVVIAREGYRPRDVVYVLVRGRVANDRPVQCTGRNVWVVGCIVGGVWRGQVDALTLDCAGNDEHDFGDRVEGWCRANPDLVGDDATALLERAADFVESCEDGIFASLGGEDTCREDRERKHRGNHDECDQDVAVSRPVILCCASLRPESSLNITFSRPLGLTVGYRPQLIRGGMTPRDSVRIPRQAVISSITTIYLDHDQVHTKGRCAAPRVAGTHIGLRVCPVRLVDPV